MARLKRELVEARENTAIRLFKEGKKPDEVLLHLVVYGDDQFKVKGMKMFAPRLQELYEQTNEEMGKQSGLPSVTVSKAPVVKVAKAAPTPTSKEEETPRYAPPVKEGDDDIVQAQCEADRCQKRFVLPRKRWQQVKDSRNGFVCSDCEKKKKVVRVEKTPKKVAA